MTELESTEPSRSRPAFVVVAGSGEPRRGRGDGRGAAPVSFDRRELNLLFNLYGTKVAAGEWRDYALHFTPAKAVRSAAAR